MEILDLSITLDSLTYEAAGSRSSARPYMWTYFFKADGSCFTINNEFRLIGSVESHCPEGSHGNLAVNRVEPGHKIDIPKKTGTSRFSLQPMLIPFFNQAIVPGVCGVVVVMLHQEGVSTGGMEAGRKVMHQYLDNALNRMISQLTPEQIDLTDVQGSVKQYFERAAASALEGLTPAIVKAIRSEQNILQNVMSLLRKDELIGYWFGQYNTVGLAQALPVNIHETITSPRMGTWQLSGQISINP